MNDKFVVSNKNIGRFIQNKRKSLGMSGKDLGVMLNISQQQVSRYENGVTNITVTMLYNTLNIFNASWDDFISFIELHK